MEWGRALGNVTGLPCSGAQGMTQASGPESGPSPREPVAMLC